LTPRGPDQGDFIKIVNIYKIPVAKKTIIERELAKLLKGKSGITHQNGEDWLNLTKEIHT